MRLLRPRSEAPSPARPAPAEVRPAEPVAEAAEEPREPAAEPIHAAERRLRGAGGPEDSATYDCRCGAVFPASPTTSVSCPLCGVHQAW